MSAASRGLARHALGLVAAALAMLAVPYVASAVSWRLSALLDGSGGVHVYALGWGASETSLDDSHAVVDPLSPALLITLATITLVCVAGDLARHKAPWLTWCLPIVPAVPLGLWVGLLATGEGVPGELPWYVPFVIGVTVTAIIAMVVAAYWATLLVAGRVLAQRAA